VVVRSPRLLVAIRLGYLVGTAATLLWAPVVRGGPGGNLLLRTFDRWDTLWFHRIVEHGYSTRQSAAFLPVYPLVVRAVAWVVRSDVAAGMLVSLVAAAGAAAVLERIARRHLPAGGAGTAVVLFALYPLAFVFTAFYSDGLFVLFVALALDAAERGRTLLAGVAAGLAVDTRLLGLALVPMLVVSFWPSWRRLAVVLLPLLALGLWLVYCHHHFGDALATPHAEERYWLRRSPSPHAYWYELRTWEVSFSNLLFHLPAHGPYPDFVVVAIKNVFDFAFLVGAVWLSVLAWRRVGPALALFSWATLALVVGAPTQYEVLVGLPRFLLADLPLFVVLASLLERRPRARELVYAGFAAVGAATAVGFARGVGII
jgi:hypothetical protein